MIDLYCGVPGSGKSCTALYDGIMHLLDGGVLATNFRFVSDWAERLADRSFQIKIGRKTRKQFIDDVTSRCFFLGSTQSIYQLSAITPGLVRGKFTEQREGKALVILDECQFYFNSRNWGKNSDFLEIFTQHRKMKLDFILIAHNIEMIDKQIRFLVEYETFFRNFTRVKLPVPFLSIKLSPYPCFLGIRQYANMGAGKAMKAKTWVQPLNKKIADLYDSFEMFSFAAEPPPLEHQRNEPRMQPVPPASPRKLTVPMYQPRPEPGTVFSRY
jgi:hypothetical protein